MRNKISLLQFLVSLSIGLYVFLTILIFIIIYFQPTDFFFMTSWNFYISTVYLITVAVCDFSLFIFKSNKLDKINEIFRETLSPAFTALTYLVTFTFWVMIFPALLTSDEDPNFGMGIYWNLYLHLFVTIFQTIDIFFSYRKNKGIIIKYDFLIGAFIMLAYSILTLILIFGFNIAIYPFFQNMTWYKFIGEALLFIVMIFVFYLIHVGLIKLKYKFKLFIIIDESKIALNLPNQETNQTNEITT